MKSGAGSCGEDRTLTWECMAFSCKMPPALLIGIEAVTVEAVTGTEEVGSLTPMAREDVALLVSFTPNPSFTTEDRGFICTISRRYQYQIVSPPITILEFLIIKF